MTAYYLFLAIEVRKKLQVFIRIVKKTHFLGKAGHQRIIFTFLTIWMASHGPLHAAEDLPIQERLYVLNEVPLECNYHRLNSFWYFYGLKHLQNKNTNSIESLKIHHFRISSRFPETVNRGTIKYKRSHRDFKFVGSIEVDLIPEYLKNQIMGIDYRTRLIDSISCEMKSIPLKIRLLLPAISSKSYILVSVSETYIQLNGEKGDSRTDVHNNVENSVNVKESLGLYPWVSQFQLKDVKITEPILVLEKSDCAENGNFFIVSVGRLLEEQHGVLQDKFKLVRSKIYAANHYYGKSGDPNTRHVVENSVDPTHYWCVPKKEFCYREIESGKFGTTVSKNKAEEVDANRVYNLRLGIVSALQLIAAENCPIE